MTDKGKTRRERASDPPPADADTRRFNDYLVELVEELTGYRPQMTSWGTVHANRVRPVSPLERDEGIKATLSGHDGPKALVEAIHRQAQIDQRISMRDASTI